MAVHESCAPSDGWKTLTNALGHTHHVIEIELNPDERDAQEQLTKFLTETIVDELVLIGHGPAAELTRQHTQDWPAQIRGLIMINPPGETQTGPPNRIRRLLHPLKATRSRQSKLESANITIHTSDNSPAAGKRTTEKLLPWLAQLPAPWSDKRTVEPTRAEVEAELTNPLWQPYPEPPNPRGAPGPTERNRSSRAR